jgi:hypothetical protein
MKFLNSYAGRTALLSAKGIPNPAKLPLIVVSNCAVVQTGQQTGIKIGSGLLSIFLILYIDMILSMGGH